MSEFMKLKKAMDQQMAFMESGELFVVDISKDELWDTYLGSFPEGTNPIFRERTEHDCQCCRQFIRACGNVVSIVNNQLVSIWDISVDNFYQEVADQMSVSIKNKPISDIFRHYQLDLGTYKNLETNDNGRIIWEHFYHKLPARFLVDEHNIPTLLGNERTKKEVFKRGLDEITEDSIETVLELIASNSLYRGSENKTKLEDFLNAKRSYDKVPETERDNYVWSESRKVSPAVATIRNTSIGTLLLDVSAEMGLDSAVRKFEAMVAPANYQRPAPVVTKSMIQKAQKTLQELGLLDAVERRYATAEDITINNLRYADRSIKPILNVFDELIEENKGKVNQTFDKIEEVSVDDFVGKILPTCNSVEMLVENRHIPNLVSLIAPAIPNSGKLFKWDNGFSWAYSGDMTDSIKERVKKAGGEIEADFRASLSWFNSDDLDVELVTPSGNVIYFGNKRVGEGVLDVDMNAHDIVPNPVENIVYKDISKMPSGKFVLEVNNYNRRSTSNVGFELELEFLGTIYNFSYEKPLRDGETVVVAEFNISGSGKNKSIEFIKSLLHSSRSVSLCGVDTEKFQKVTMVMDSPNYWDGQEVGNKHLFFILDKCINEERARGFFNEFLDPALRKHRKVFEVLGDKMRAPESNNQLTGLGFSSTQRNSAIFKISGKFSRTIKVNF